MGAVLSSAAAIDSVLKSARNYARRWIWLWRPMDQDDAAADWSGLPQDLLLIVMAVVLNSAPALAHSVSVVFRLFCATALM
jgi:hypothetical protein